jgi:hypothetical protein
MIMTSLVTWNCAAIASEAGATIDEDTGLINVKRDTTIVAVHFFPYVQLQASVVNYPKRENVLKLT